MSKKKTNAAQTEIARMAGGIITVTETMKEMLLGAVMHCDFQLDLTKAAQGLSECGVEFTPNDLEGLLVAYCNIIKAQNKRIIKVDVKHPAPNVVMVVFTLRVFDGGELPLIDEQVAQKLFVTSGDFQKFSKLKTVIAR